MRRSLVVFACCAPFYAAAGYAIVLTAIDFPESGIRRLDWVFLAAMGIVVPCLQSVYLVRDLEKGSITDRIRWLAIWPSAIASLVVLIAVTMIRRVLAG